ncbi:ead/Ea22-like family protein [Klebsiella pneumoniae]|uniref:ead/Ea22-like family protein n=1 Tax=Klebsiella pneumoniae TaxID=573 RepID=UPI000C7A7BEF|nr:ead/Ea22-like family protein [Klebsiella pneumoniae]PLK54474.1 Ead domain protein [Klebsiella pneumoniae]PLK68325.1 Ead domain protein [Klebsiella pneumoniae]PLL00010.1 Ead domain protein [Klebsiella pneumoniae]PLN32645.1 Ead domain protein [Klebsiella pneumoniae]PLN56645.1 Ead domain protein [Klebsiella pneumoniae]
MTDITELAQSLKAAAEKATQGNWRAFQYHDGRCGIGGGHHDEIMVCEHISKERPHDAMFIALANPANVLALVEALEKAQANITKERELRVSAENRACWLSVAGLVTELETAQQVDYELCKLLPPGVEYMDPPDGGDVTPLEGVRRMVADYRQRIAELESRTVTVKLPESFKLAKSSSGLRYYYADEVDAALTAAGIKVEAE